MRTMQDVQKDYAAAATQLGDLAYRISAIDEDMRGLKRKMRQLNTEARGIENAKHNESIAAGPQTNVVEAPSEQADA